MTSKRRDDIAYRSLLLVLGVLGRVPLRLGSGIARCVTRIALRFADRDRMRIEEHLAIAFPELDRVQRRRLLKGCADHFGRMLAEVAWLRRASAADVRDLVSIDGLERITSRVEQGSGVVIITGHIGNWELLNAGLCAYGVPLTIAVRELDDPRLDGLITSLRERFGSEVVPRGVSAGKTLLRALLRRRAVGLLIDQDIPSIPGVFVPFFGRPAWTPSGAAMIGLRAGCDTLPTFIHRRPDGSHLIKVEEPLKGPADLKLDERVWALTAASTARVEWHVRAWPEQWVWMHRRWRTQREDRT